MATLKPGHRRVIAHRATVIGLAAALLAGAAMVPPVHADEVPAEEIVVPPKPTAPARPPEPKQKQKDWEFVFTPYLWLTGLNGNASLAGNDVDIDVNFFDILSSSDFAFGLMGDFDVFYKRKFGLFANPLGLVVKDNNVGLPPTPLQADIKMTQVIVDFGAYYQFLERSFRSGADSPTWALQGIVGGRYTSMAVDFNIQGGPNPEFNESWTDPVFGGRALFQFGKDNRWGFRLKGDIGGFGVASDLTGQGAGIFTYDFNIKSVSSAVVFGYRGLYTDYAHGVGPTRFVWDIWTHGPLLGLAFKF